MMPGSYQTVTTTGVRRLYHYQGFNAEHLRSLIIDNTVYFSAPYEFNDPWDCKPWLKVPYDLAGREQIIQWFDKTNRRQSLTPSEILKAQEIQRLRDDPDLLRIRIEEVSTAIVRELGNQYRLYCLTSSNIESIIQRFI